MTASLQHYKAHVYQYYEWYSLLNLETFNTNNNKLRSCEDDCGLFVVFWQIPPNASGGTTGFAGHWALWEFSASSWLMTTILWMWWWHILSLHASSGGTTLWPTSRWVQNTAQVSFLCSTLNHSTYIKWSTVKWHLSQNHFKEIISPKTKINRWENFKYHKILIFCLSFCFSRWKRLHRVTRSHGCGGTDCSNTLKKTLTARSLETISCRHHGECCSGAAVLSTANWTPSDPYVKAGADCDFLKCCLYLWRRQSLM